jgi:hypothetical protein
MEKNPDSGAGMEKFRSGINLWGSENLCHNQDPDPHLAGLENKTYAYRGSGSSFSWVRKPTDTEREQQQKPPRKSQECDPLYCIKRSKTPKNPVRKKRIYNASCTKIPIRKSSITLTKVRISHQHPVEPRTVLSDSLNTLGCSLL